MQFVLQSDCDAKELQKQFNVKDATLAVAFVWNRRKVVTPQWYCSILSDEVMDEDPNVFVHSLNIALGLAEVVASIPSTNIPLLEVIDGCEVEV